MSIVLTSHHVKPYSTATIAATDKIDQLRESDSKEFAGRWPVHSRPRLLRDVAVVQLSAKHRADPSAAPLSHAWGGEALAGCDHLRLLRQQPKSS